MDLKQALQVAKDIDEIVDLPGNGPEQETYEALIIIRNEMTDLFKKINQIHNFFAIYHKAHAKADRQIKAIDNILCNWVTGVKEQ